MRRLERLSALLLLCPLALGCARAAPPPSSPVAEATVAPSATHAALLGELGQLERRLLEDAAQPTAQQTASREALLARRLVVTVALAELARGETEQDGDALLERAEREVKRRRAETEAERARDRAKHAAEKKDAKEKQKASGDPWGREYEQGRADAKPEPKLEEPDEPAPPPALEGGEGGGCAPGDPLCSSIDDEPPLADPNAPRPIAAARVHDSNGPQGVMNEVRRHFPRVQACLPTTAGDDGLRVRVTVRIDDRGAFREPRVIGNAIDPRVASCVEGVFRDIRMPTPAQGSRLVTVPLWLRR